MVARERTRGPGRPARRFGYAVAAALNGLFLYLVNVAPGWDVVPFLTPDTERVIGLLNLSLWVGVIANLVYVLDDRPWIRGVGEVLTTSVGLAVMVRLWQVFPFDVTSGWETVFRVLIGIGIFGSILGLLVTLGRLARSPRRAHV